MERQHLIFIAAAASIFGALLVAGLYLNNPFKASNGASNNSTNAAAGGSSDVLKLKRGQSVDLRYSAATTALIQKLPSRNNVTIEVSSELHNTNFAGVSGEVRYKNEIVTFVRDGKVQSVPYDIFKTIEYRFSPDRGNTTKYTFENVNFIPDSSGNGRVYASFMALPNAKVGDICTVKLILDTGTQIKYSVGEKTIEIVA